MKISPIVLCYSQYGHAMLYNAKTNFGHQHKTMALDGLEQFFVAMTNIELMPSLTHHANLIGRFGCN